MLFSKLASLTSDKTKRPITSQLGRPPVIVDEIKEPQHPTINTGTLHTSSTKGTSPKEEKNQWLTELCFLEMERGTLGRYVSLIRKTEWRGEMAVTANRTAVPCLHRAISDCCHWSSFRPAQSTSNTNVQSLLEPLREWARFLSS